MELADAVDAEGVVCAVGAGGKKSLLYALAGRVDRAVVTATVRIPIFDEHVSRVVVTDDPATAVHDTTEWPLGVVPEREREDRYRGYEPERIASIADAGANAVLVKADGARTRRLKAPGEHEPQIPDCADVVVPIASVRAVGEPLSEAVAHRPERVAAITDLAGGDEIRPEDVARVLAHPEGGMKDVPGGATVIPLVNMADDTALVQTATEIAEGVHDRVDVPRVVVTSLKADEPVKTVV
ncbi:putative selenium-dependent hydroxylase accessory protein YqeC [Halobacterium sp. KA-4]|uniref:selenium cofactor biosynthesis protein YqeC n=1 Tax=Halobacterium sp. KA-4 TaxID=2896367 RepID=UPI001E4598B2|nr:selenium cofactor biosynthesis protein YqeC [Halobacterium sp. KA-4]MCD2199270.1 putative selenium-dependent hydroxylase accessory protein YqeC [Halobacterium sp. KA-4]